MDVRRRVPRTDEVLGDPRLREAEARLGRGLVKAAVTRAQERARAGEIPPEEVPGEAVAGLPERATELRPVVNATGVLLHTNLGRAPLSDAARGALDAAAGCTDVEYDLGTGRRARRGRGTLQALREAVPAAEAAHVVNNNAAALVLAATALAGIGGQIVISRGELVEIGDGFRIPELLEGTGAELVEVGTTNRTTAEDYRRAIGPRTGFLLKVHPSNFRVEGFTSEASVAELAKLGPPVVADIGSGLLTPHSALPDEPDATTMLRHGAALVTASGDKLLGGPQAGIMLGTEDVVERCRRHPIARALRVDKLTLAALEATLRGPATPTAEGLAVRAEDLMDRAKHLAATLTEQGIPAEAVTCTGAVGGGGAPGVELPSAAVALPEHYAEPLRLGPQPGTSPGAPPGTRPGTPRGASVVGRVEDGRLLLDLRAVPPAQDPVIIAAVTALPGGPTGGHTSARTGGRS